MKSFFKNIPWGIIFTSLVSLVIGLCFLMFPTESLTTVCYILGAVMILAGIVGIVGYLTNHHMYGLYTFSVGASLLLLGIYVLVCVSVVSTLLVTIFGIVLIVDSMNKLQQGIDLARCKVKGWVPMIIIALICGVLGCLIVFQVFPEFIMYVLGGALLFDAIVGGAFAVFAKYKQEKVKTLPHANVVDQPAEEQPMQGEVIEAGDDAEVVSTEE